MTYEPLKYIYHFYVFMALSYLPAGAIILAVQYFGDGNIFVMLSKAVVVFIYMNLFFRSSWQKVVTARLPMLRPYIMRGVLLGTSLMIIMMSNKKLGDPATSVPFFLAIFLISMAGFGAVFEMFRAFLKGGK